MVGFMYICIFSVWLEIVTKWEIKELRKEQKQQQHCLLLVSSAWTFVRDKEAHTAFVLHGHDSVNITRIKRSKKKRLLRLETNSR